MTDTISASMKIKWAILELAHLWQDKDMPVILTEADIEDLWDEQDCLWDATNEIRTSGEETGLPGQYSRHYESEEVAIQCPDGSWVGFTHWYGGGKHGEPESIDWIEHAYDVNVTSTQKMVTINTFTKATPTEGKAE